jgi:transposase
LASLPEVAGGVVTELSEQLLFLHTKIAGYSREMTRVAQGEERVALLQTIPGIGPITASAIVAIGDAKQFRTGRDLAAWLGLTPLNRSSGGKEKLGRITKKGDQYIRKLLVVGMTSRALLARTHPERTDAWTANVIAEKPFRLATVALANKSARVIWALLAKGTEYRAPTF